MVSSGNKEEQSGGRFGSGIHGRTWDFSRYGNIVFDYGIFITVLDTLIQRAVGYLIRRFKSDMSDATILLNTIYKPCLSRKPDLRVAIA